MADSSLAVAITGLSFRHRGRRRPTLQNVSFNVGQGETLLVLGPSGCGKSTLALCLNGLIPHNIPGELTGQIVVAGQNLCEATVAETARNVGIVFQDPDSQFCMLRVDDEIAFGLENFGVASAEMPARIEHALALVGLAGTERWRIDRLSGGGRQRLALACVLALDPPVLVLDEPTSNLDPAGAEDVFADIARLKAAGGRTLIIVEHRLDHLMHLVDRVLVLGPEGTVIAHDAPARVLRDQAEQLEEYGIWIPQVSELANRLSGLGYACEPYPLTVRQAVATLERLLPSRLAIPVESLEIPAKQISDTSGSDLALEVNRLSFSYPSGRQALRDASIRVPDGSFFAIVGPNGAGKSTLASHLIGTIEPPWGAIHLFGRDLRTMRSTELTETVGYVFQNPEHQFVAGVVFDELAFGLRRRGLPEPEIRERVESMLNDFGLTALAKANPFALSHGEKRRLSVAAMLILGQRMLVLDEPTFGQDRRNTAALMATLAHLQRAGRTVVMITHDVRLVAEHAQLVAVLIDGSIPFIGRPADLFRDAGLVERAHLTLPPFLEVSRRLRDDGFVTSEAVTVDAFAASLARAMERGSCLVSGLREVPGR